MTAQEAGKAIAPARESTYGRAWAAVAVLAVVGVFNYVDRLLPGFLAEPIKRELGLSDTFLGVLNGVGFLVIYAIAGIPIARLADAGRYGLVISGSLAGLAAVLQSIYSDGLTHVSVFIEPYNAELHRHELLMAMGATQTLARKQGAWWLTVIGDVPVVTLRAFASAMEHRP